MKVSKQLKIEIKLFHVSFIGTSLFSIKVMTEAKIATNDTCCTTIRRRANKPKLQNQDHQIGKEDDVAKVDCRRRGKSRVGFHSHLWVSQHNFFIMYGFINLFIDGFLPLFVLKQTFRKTKLQSSLPWNSSSQPSH